MTNKKVAEYQIKKCKVCGDKTTNGFNIDLKHIAICESCANSIMLQQASWLVKNMQTVDFLISHPANASSQKRKTKKA